MGESQLQDQEAKTKVRRKARTNLEAPKETEHEQFY